MALLPALSPQAVVKFLQQGMAQSSLGCIMAELPQQQGLCWKRV